MQSSVSDIDFEEKHISVDHQLQRTRDMQYIIEDTKTTSGIRTIPMTEEVYECFKRIVENRKKPKKEPAIDGYKGYATCCNALAAPIQSHGWQVQRYLQSADAKHYTSCM